MKQLVSELYVNNLNNRDRETGKKKNRKRKEDSI